MESKRTGAHLRAARKWVRANRDWLTDDHEPLVQQLLGLAESMDAEAAAGRPLQAATAANYRLTMVTLMGWKPIEQQRRDKLEAETDSLMSPAEWMA